MSVVCQYYVGFMSVLCQYVKQILIGIILKIRHLL